MRLQLEYSPSHFDWLAQYARNLYSQFGEDGILAKIFEVIGTANRWCAEVGASDGITWSNTRRLIEQGWDAVQIEGDDDRAARLAVRYKNNSKVHVYPCRVDLIAGPTLEDILARAGCPTDLDLLVIDVDGEDYHFFNSLWKYKPRVVMVEYNSEPLHPEQVPAIGEGNIQTQAGFKPLLGVAYARGYFSLCRTNVNLICVREDLAGLLVDPQVIAEELRKQAGEEDAAEK